MQLSYNIPTKYLTILSHCFCVIVCFCLLCFCFPQWFCLPYDLKFYLFSRQSKPPDLIQIYLVEMRTYMYIVFSFCLVSVNIFGHECPSCSLADMSGYLVICWLCLILCERLSAVHDSAGSITPLFTLYMCACWPFKQTEMFFPQ